MFILKNIPSFTPGFGPFLIVAYILLKLEAGLLDQGGTNGWSHKLKSLSKIMNIWTSQKLILKDKVTILKSLLLPHITHLLSVYYCPQAILDCVNRMLLSFLWNKKTPKIK